MNSPLSERTSPVNQYGDAYSEVLEEVLRTAISEATLTVVEYGSGFSTKLICDAVDALGSSRRDDLIVLSIDHVVEWQRIVAQDLPFRPYLHLRTYDLTGRCLSPFDLGYNYATSPAMLGRQLDVVFVDGRTRAQAVLWAGVNLSPGGVIILDDGTRERYGFLDQYFHSVEVKDRFKIFRDPKVRGSSRPALRESRAVVRVVAGERAQREADITRHSVARYARSISAELIDVRLPPDEIAATVKLAARDLVRSHDRTLLLDSDVVIRPGAPDVFNLVPSTMVGAMREDWYVDRKEWLSEVDELYDLPPSIDPAYFNSGVMVLSSAHAGLLDPDPNDTIFAHPAFEQTFLNARVRELGLSLYPLQKEFNYISGFDDPFAPDWRYGWFIHVAGSWMPRPGRTGFAWEHVGDVRGSPILRRRPIGVRDVRIGLLEDLAVAVEEGRNILSLPSVCMSASRQRYRYQGDQVAIRLQGPIDQILVYGPYLDLLAGVYDVTFKLCREGHTPESIGFDVICESATRRLAQGTIIVEDGQATTRIHIDEPVSGVEVRLFGTAEADAALASISLERLSFGSTAAHLENVSAASGVQGAASGHTDL